MRRMLTTLFAVFAISTPVPASAYTPSIGDAWAISGVETVLVQWVPNTGDVTNIKFVATVTPGGQSCEIIDGSMCKIEKLLGGTTVSITIVGTTTTGYQFSKTIESVVVKAGPPAITNISVTPGNRKLTVSFPTPKGAALPDGLTYVVRTDPLKGTCVIQHNSQNPVSSCEIGGLTNGSFYDIIVTSEARDLKKESEVVKSVKPTYDPTAKFTASLKPAGVISRSTGSLRVSTTGSIPGKYCVRVVFIQASQPVIDTVRSNWAYYGNYIQGSGGSLPDGLKLSGIGGVANCLPLGNSVLKSVNALPKEMGWKTPTRPGKYYAYAAVNYSNDEFRRFRAPDELVALSPLVPITVR